MWCSKYLNPRTPNATIGLPEKKEASFSIFAWSLYYV